MDRQIGAMDNLLLRFGARYIVSLAAFAVPYLLTHVFTRKDLFADPLFIVLLIIAPAIADHRSGHFCAEDGIVLQLLSRG